MNLYNDWCEPTTIPDDTHAASLASAMEWSLLSLFDRVHRGSELQQLTHRVDACLPYAGE